MVNILHCAASTRNLAAGMAMMILWATPSHADQPARLTYEVYAGGVHVVQANLNLDLKKSSYHADLVATTRGFLGRLVPWHGSFDSKGVRRGDGRYVVNRHRSLSSWKGSDDIAEYSYDGRGNFKKLKITDNGKDKTPKEIDPKLTKGTTDILTATLNMMNASIKSGACDYTSDIFDSRRRFKLKYTTQGDAILKPTKYSFYQGLAMKCIAEVIPDGGAWKKKPRGWLSIQEQGRKKGTMPTLWLAKVSSDVPPVPVRIMIKTDYGTLFMHLARMVDTKGRAWSAP
jgi:Protein of unknown function (DUF3108)